MALRPLLISIGVVVLLGSTAFVVRRQQLPTVEMKTVDTTEKTALPVNPEPVVQKDYFYPMTGYATRITNRHHGQHITPADRDGLACGDAFSGYHAGDDLEVTPAELNQEVPVYAIAAGTVRETSNVGGYGGLLVTEHTINGQALTAYYGHIDLSQLKVKEGDSVTPGQLLTYLGDNCSAETSNERKHLHFDIHKGTSIDVRGYLPSLAELENWLNPAEFLQSLNAAEPA